MNQSLKRSFFIQDAVSLAQALLGKVLVRNINGQIIKARIVETEAYMGATDKACHSYGHKKTKRTLPMYDLGGTTYVYLIYGMYYCFNIIANKKDNPQAVLIRAVEIIAGHEVLEHTLSASAFRKPKHQQTNGPGKLCAALKIDFNLNHLSLQDNPEISLIDDGYQLHRDDIIATKRINIDYAQEDKDQLWRFHLKDSRFISKFIK